MRIAIVRGSSLNKWEMQNYEPLKTRHNILAIGSFHHSYDTLSIKLPIKKLLCLGNILSPIPMGIKALYKAMGDTMCLMGFEEAISGFDIIHTTEAANYYTLQSIKAKEKGLVKKVVVTVWETIPFLGDNNPKRLQNKQEVYKKADLFLAVTKQAKKALLKEGVNPKKIQILPLGVDTKVFNPQKKNPKLTNKLPIKLGDKIILFVGRIVAEKGVFDLLEALYRIKSRADWQCLIVGSGPERQSLIAKLKDYGLFSRVMLFGSASYKIMPEVMNLADIFILPSIKTTYWEEQFGMVLVEAMACGKAVVTTSGIQTDIIGQEGIVIPQKSPTDLQKALEKLLDNRNYRLRLGLRARKKVLSEFDSAKISKKLDQIYRHL